MVTSVPWRLSPVLVLAVLLGLGTVVLPGGRAVRAELAPPVIAVVDVQYLLQESAAARDIHRQLEAQREIYQNEIAEQEDKLRAAEEELARQRTILSREAFIERRREFEKQVAEVQRQVQSRKRALDQAFNEAMNELRSNLLQVVAEIAQEEGATLVLAKSQVVLVEKSLDLTEEVMESLDRKLPKIAVTVGQVD